MSIFHKAGGTADTNTNSLSEGSEQLQTQGWFDDEDDAIVPVSEGEFYYAEPVQQVPSMLVTVGLVGNNSSGPHVVTMSLEQFAGLANGGNVTETLNIYSAPGPGNASEGLNEVDDGEWEEDQYAVPDEVEPRFLPYDHDQREAKDSKLDPWAKSELVQLDFDDLKLFKQTGSVEVSHNYAFLANKAFIPGSSKTQSSNPLGQFPQFFQ